MEENEKSRVKAVTHYIVQEPTATEENTYDIHPLFSLSGPIIKH